MTGENSRPLPTGRTGHACAQCRDRKQRCGGFTHETRCRPCTSRKAHCSFVDEINDPRFNPYLRVSVPAKSPTAPEPAPLFPLATSTIGAASVPVAATASHDAQSTVLQDLLSFAGADGGPAFMPPAPNGLSEQVDLLRNQLADLQRQLDESQRPQMAPPADLALPDLPFLDQSPIPELPPPPPPLSRSQSQSAFVMPQMTTPDAPSLPSPQDALRIDGPISALNSIQNDLPLETETHDPIVRSVITEGEAFVIMRIFFTHCHPNAPFLDIHTDSDIDHVRASSVLLFLSIICVGARFWSASSKTACWLHPRYSELVALLDAEVMRVTLRPGPEDGKLETIQALLLCAHWMPFDAALAHAGGYRSRFSEAGAWQCMGLAIRWATSLSLERTCHLAFRGPVDGVTRDDARRCRTMLYLVESDHYLALSARRPPCLDTRALSDVLANFLRCKHLQATDVRVTSLFRAAHSAHVTGCRPTTIESVEAFDRDMELVERHFASSSSRAGVAGAALDALGPHFPFTSLGWYRLSYACAFLDAADAGQRDGLAMRWALEWASNILGHFSRPPAARAASGALSGDPPQPDPALVQVMSYAIDHYFVVIAYAAFFLVNGWLSNLINANLEPSTHEPTGDTSATRLFRLVDVAARTLEAASPPKGHLARRYVPLLRGMTGIIQSGKTPADAAAPGTATGTGAGAGAASGAAQQPVSNLEEDLWGMWQQTGLDASLWPNLLDGFVDHGHVEGG
ncbi:hypothetical protein Q5752_006693 [Cryptotrichosporon argae]